MIKSPQVHSPQAAHTPQFISLDEPCSKFVSETVKNTKENNYTNKEKY